MFVNQQGVEKLGLMIRKIFDCQLSAEPRRESIEDLPEMADARMLEPVARTNTNRRREFIWVIVVSLLLLSFGCESPISEDVVQVDRFVNEGIEQVSDAGEPELVADTEAGKRGGFLRIPTGNTWTPDPAIDDSPDSQMLYSEIYNGLTTISDKDSDPFQPDLAQNFQIDDDGKTYSFLLRPELKFSDGSPLTSSDVKWSWERALKPSTGSSRAWDVLGAIQGAGSVAKGEKSELNGVEVVDERRLIVKLENPRPDFLALLADPVASILKRENVESWKADWARFWNGDPEYIHTWNDVLPIGTGPFRLTKFVAFTGPCILERNEHYFGRPAYLDAVEFVGDHEHDASGDSHDGIFENELIDLIPRESAAHKGKFEKFESAPVTAFLVFNTALPPYDDVDFRRGLVSSVNVADLDRLSVPWEVAPASRIVPPGITQFGEAVEAPSFDLEAAAEYLRNSRYQASQTRLEFYTFLDGLFEPEIEQLEAEWRENIGLNGIGYLARDIGTYRLLENEGSLATLGFLHAVEYPDPYAALRVFDETFGPGNSSPEAQMVEQMLHDASAELDAAARFERYAAVEQYILDEGIALPLYWSTQPSGFQLQPWVHGFKMPKYGGSWFADVWFDETAPKRELPLE